MDRAALPQDRLIVVIAGVATLSALAVLALVLATWSWAWLAPGAEPRAMAAMPAEVAVEPAFHLFGTATAQSTASVASTGLAVRLLGIVAAEAGGRGYALLQFDGKESFAAHVGQLVADGVTLAEIGEDHVVIERNGQRERLDWPKAPAAAPAGPLQ